ncbi:MAG: multidrug ABC transporter ATP-binding protein [Rickettsiales bacterium]|nr:multidrug ABC transporter ATP-binding protein [Rickettsiales bacterium]|tara:strand:+ start:130 stop:1077 length:948 start_codon:yes stop_codon:yes gene_type:complete
MTKDLPEYALEIENLRKIYTGGSQPPKEALKGVSLKVKRGSMFALLGPNGAGKSTMINIMAGLVNKTEGSVKIWDHDIDTDTRRAKSSIGIVPQELNLDAFFTPKEALDLQAGLYGIPKKERRTQELLELVGLEDKADAYARRLSGGMRRRLMVAKAMVHNPPILVLDEPTAGVDIELRQQLWDNVRAMNDMGVTIMLTTHYLEEAQELCDTIAIINHGELVAFEDKNTLIRNFGLKELIITTAEEIKSVPKKLDIEKITSELINDNQIKLKYNPLDISFDEIITRISESKYTIKDLSTNDADLEDIFLSYTKAA